MSRFPRSLATKLSRVALVAAASLAGARAQQTLSVDRLDATDPGGPAPSHLVVVDVFTNVATTDTWTASGLRATTANGATLRYGFGDALLNPGLADRFVTCVSRPLARNANGRFDAALAAVAGAYDPTAQNAVAMATEVNVAWFSSPPATSTSPSVDGYVARVVIDVSAVPAIHTNTIVVALGAPPAGAVPLLLSQPIAGPAGTVGQSFDVSASSGINWSVYFAPCETYTDSSDPSVTVAGCNTVPFGTAATVNLATVFAQNNGGAVGGAVFFDVNVAAGLYLDRLSLNTGTTAGTPMTVQVYRTVVGGTRVGNETDAAVWIPETMGFGTAGALNTKSVVELNSPFFLAPGTYGIAVVAHGFAHAFTDGANAFSNADLTITTGAATDVPFSGPVSPPRTPNLELRYHLDSQVSCNAHYQTIVRRSQMLAGPITGLAFAPCGTGRHWNDSLLIRMSHVPANHVLSTTFATNLPAPVTVLNANDYVWHVTANQWCEVGLQAPFAYDGVRDVVIDIVSRGNYHTVLFSGFRTDGTQPRVVARGWTGAVPTVATVSDNSALKMRLQFGCANAAEFGWSCGRIRAGHSGEPILGQQFSFTFTDAPPNQTVFLSLGFGNASPPYPLSLALIGLRNCELFHDMIATVQRPSDATGSGSDSYLVPVTQAMIGFKLYGQWLAFDASAPDGLAASNYVRISCGI